MPGIDLAPAQAMDPRQAPTISGCSRTGVEREAETRACARALAAAAACSGACPSRTVRHRSTVYPIAIGATCTCTT